MRRFLLLLLPSLASLAACTPGGSQRTVATIAPASAPVCAAPGVPPYRSASMPARSGEAPPQLDVHVPNDAESVRAIVREGTTHSRVASDLQYLTDVIGPRLTGSVAMRRANDWTRDKFREYGADSAWLEAWTFGCAWERGPLTIRMLAPQRRELMGASWAWAPGTNGGVAGPVVRMDATTTEEFLARYRGKLRGAWVLTSASVPMHNPDGPVLSALDSVALDSARRAAFARPRSPEAERFADSMFTLLAAEGVAGQLRSGAKEFALLTMSGSPARVLPIVSIVLSQEDYTQLERLLARGETPRIEATVSNRFSPEQTTVYNTVAEIRGRERPDEVVLLGAHLDSWDLATGATDNATGSIAVLEAARILKASGVRPRRTIRFALFSGEEQGLYGSRVYAMAHAAEMPRYQSVLVLDNGTGRITGMALQGRDELAGMWRALFAPTAELGPFRVRSGNKGGTDHLSFLPYGVPGFNYDQESRGYDHTHHSQVDSYDHTVPSDIQQAATVMAATAYELANLPELLPRNGAAVSAR